MGQKVNPVSFRIGQTENYRSRWFASGKTFSEWLLEDCKVREYFKKNFGKGLIEKVEIEREKDSLKVYIFTASAGILIGKKGATIEKIKEDLEGLTKKKVNVNVKQVEKVELSAQLVAEAIALELEKRASHRRVMHKAIDTAMAAGARGIKVRVGGRIGGIEIARAETLQAGKLPLGTLNAIVDYGFAEADIAKGKVSVKTWIFKGYKDEQKITAQQEQRNVPQL
ncbi:MAG: 30S ribosomal protein S3 [Planctomycetota bacterium]